MPENNHNADSPTFAGRELTYNTSDGRLNYLFKSVIDKAICGADWNFMVNELTRLRQVEAEAVKLYRAAVDRRPRDAKDMARWYPHTSSAAARAQAGQEGQG